MLIFSKLKKYNHLYFYLYHFKVRKKKAAKDNNVDNLILSDEEMKNFFVDFFKYIFDYSNFSQFNKMNDLEVKHDVKTEQNGKKHTIWTMVKKDRSPLVISMSQAADPQK